MTAQAIAHGSPWTAAQEYILATLWKAHATRQECLRRLPGRSWRGIEWHAYRMGLPPRSGRKQEARSASSQKGLPKEPPRLPVPASPEFDRRRARARQLAELLRHGPVAWWLLRQKGETERGMRAILDESGEWFAASSGELALSDAGRAEFGFSAPTNGAHHKGRKGAGK